MKGWRAVYLLLLVMLLSTACGYKLVGRETHLPQGVASIAIPTFKNRTLEPGIEILFTQAFLREFLRDQRVKVVCREEADAILEGVIKSYEYYSVAYDRSGLASEYRATALIDLTLRKRSGEVIWKENDLSETKTYRVSNVTALSESNKNRALREIAALAAGRVRNRFFHNF